MTTANQIGVYLDPTQMPNQSQPQATFDANMAAFFANLPTFGAQFNAAVANLNSAFAGNAYAIPYTIDLSATTDADPGSGKLRFDNATQNLAATLRLDLLGTNSVDYTAMIDTFDASTSTVKGAIRVVKLGDASKFLLFNVTARSAPTGYRDISVTSVASSSANPFVAGDAVLLFFQRTGDQGSPGTYPTLYVREEQAAGTTSATSTSSGAWNTCVLNTTKVNEITGASLSSNQVTLPAGTYEFEGSVPLYGGTVTFKGQLFNVSDGVVVDNGTVEGTPSTYAASSRSIMRGKFTLSASKVLSVRRYANSTASAAPTLSAAGVAEVYTEIKFKKVL